MLLTIAIILLIGAFLGFVFSKKGKEGEGAIAGAKTAGCLIVLSIFLLIAAVVVLVIFLSI